MKKNIVAIVVAAVIGSVAVGFVGCATSRDSESHKRSAGRYIDDKVVAQRVRSALGDNDIYKFPDVKVNSFNGTVQLGGFVETTAQKTKAEEVARNVKGVMNIENNIVLKGETERVRGTTEPGNWNDTNRWQNTQPNNMQPNTQYAPPSSAPNTTPYTEPGTTPNNTQQ